MYNFDIFKNVKNIELLQKFYVQNINILVQDFYYRGLGPIWYFQNSKSKKYLQKITPYFRLTYIFDGPHRLPHMYDFEWRSERGGAVNCGAIHCWRKFVDSPQRAPTPTLRLVENRERLPGFPHCEKIKVSWYFNAVLVLYFIKQIIPKPYFRPFEKW